MNYIHKINYLIRSVVRFIWHNPKFCFLVCLLLVILYIIHLYTLSTQKHITEKPPVEFRLNDSLSNKLSDGPHTKKMERYIQKWMSRNCIRGVSIAIMKDQKLVYCKGLGWADKENGIAVETGNIFRIASASKLITAVGIMKLVDEGKLNLNDKVFGPQGILPQFTKIGDKRINDITVMQLLDHTSGFSRRKGDPMFRTADIIEWEHLETTPTSDEIIDFQLQMKLRDKPGRSSQYSNVGYLVLTRVIEEKSGEDYESYITNHVLKPAGCYDMHLANNYYEGRYPNEVKYYGHSPEDKINSFDGSGEKKLREYGGNDIHGLMGAGAWVTSAAELMRLVASIDGKSAVPDIISKKSVLEMRNTRTENDFALGWARYHDKEKSLIRTGTMSGTSACIELRDQGLSFVIITNTSHYKGPHFTNSLIGMMHKAMDLVPQWDSERDLFVSTRNDIKEKPKDENNENKQK